MNYFALHTTYVNEIAFLHEPYILFFVTPLLYSSITGKINAGIYGTNTLLCKKKIDERKILAFHAKRL